MQIITIENTIRAAGEPVQNFPAGITQTFARLMKRQHENADPSAPCIEWYRSDDEMLCMLRVKTETMHTVTILRDNLLSEIKNDVQWLNTLFADNNPAILNAHPGKGGWTIAQVLEHITLSTHHINTSLQLHATSANRDIAARKRELEETFLNYEKKFRSPEFIEPADIIYDPVALLHRFNCAMNRLFELSEETELSGMIQHRVFGDITKLELLYFVRFHTQRHCRQAENILRHLPGNKN